MGEYREKSGPRILGKTVVGIDKEWGQNSW